MNTGPGHGGVLDLSDELLLFILSHCQQQDLFRASSSCARLRALVFCSRGLCKRLTWRDEGEDTSLVNLASFLWWLQKHNSLVEEFACLTESCAAILTALSLLPHLRVLHVELQQDADEVEVGVPVLLNSFRCLLDLQSLSVRPQLINQPAQNPLAMDLSALAHLTSLTSMCFCWRVWSAGLSRFCAAKSSSLQRLEIDVGPWDVGLSPLSCLTRLTSIRLHGCSERLPADSLIQCFASMLRLSHVSLDDMWGVTSLGLNSNTHTDLQQLSLSNIADLQSLPARSCCFPKLTSVSIKDDRGRSQAQLDELLAPLSQRQAARFSTSMQSLTLKIVNMPFPAISTSLPNLSRLRLQNGEFDCLPAGLSGLQYLTELQCDACSNLCVSSSLIMSLPALQQLSLRCCATSNNSQSLLDLRKIHPTLRKVDLDAYFPLF